MRQRPYPFKKNRYYTGKLLNAEDFEKEQACFDDKTAFQNMWNCGAGIGAGLRVQKIDGDSILLESGFAVDGNGRFLIRDSQSIIKVRAIEGFGSLHSDFAVLRLEYTQEKTAPAFSSFGNGRDQTEYGTLCEGTQLRLVEPGTEPENAVENALFFRSVLFFDHDVKVSLEVPRFFAADGVTLARLRVRKLCPEVLRIHLYCAPEVPGFVRADTGELPALERDAELDQWEKVYSIPLRGTGGAGEIVMSCGVEQFRLEKRGQEFAGQEAFREEIPVLEGSPQERVWERLRQLSMDELWSGAEVGVPLAWLRFVRLKDVCMLDEIIPPEDTAYANNPALFAAAFKCYSFFSYTGQESSGGTSNRLEASSGKSGVPENGAQRVGAEKLEAPWFATGSAQLEAGLDYKPGTVLRTEEIAHGLGPGMVYLDFGVENILLSQRKNQTEILLGNNALFEQVNGEYMETLETGAKLYPERGTFQLAVRCMRRLDQPVIRLRWYAFRTHQENARRVQEGRLQRIEPEIVRLRPGESVSLVPVFSEGAHPSYEFVMDDTNSGIVTRGGIYTAPKEAGFYTVYAQVRGDEEQRTCAFVIVKGGDEK